MPRGPIQESRCRSGQLSFEPMDGDHHTQGPGDELNGKKNENHLPAQMEKALKIKARREHDKKHGDEQDTEALLEIEDLLQGDVPHVGKPDAHDRNSEQAGSVLNIAGDSKDKDDQPQGGHVWRNSGSQWRRRMLP